MGLLLFGPPAAFPKTLLQPWLVATPNQLILGDRRSEARAAQKDLFLERSVETLLVPQRYHRDYTDCISRRYFLAGTKSSTDDASGRMSVRDSETSKVSLVSQAASRLA